MCALVDSLLYGAGLGLGLAALLCALVAVPLWFERLSMRGLVAALRWYAGPHSARVRAFEHFLRLNGHDIPF